MNELYQNLADFFIAYLWWFGFFVEALRPGKAKVLIQRLTPARARPRGQNFAYT
jgi:hypothetical protein